MPLSYRFQLRSKNRKIIHVSNADIETGSIDSFQLRMKWSLAFVVTVWKPTIFVNKWCWIWSCYFNSLIQGYTWLLITIDLWCRVQLKWNMMNNYLYVLKFKFKIVDEIERMLPLSSHNSKERTFMEIWASSIVTKMAIRASALIIDKTCWATLAMI